MAAEPVPGLHLAEFVDSDRHEGQQSEVHRTWVERGVIARDCSALLELSDPGQNGRRRHVQTAGNIRVGCASMVLKNIHDFRVYGVELCVHVAS